MFYRLIKKKCDEWMESPDCTIRELIQYIYTQNKMRDYNPQNEMFATFQTKRYFIQNETSSKK